MPRVRLQIKPATDRPSRSFIERDGHILPLHEFRLTTRIRLGMPPGRGVPDRRSAMKEAIVDTGAPISIFPRSVWLGFANEIEKLSLLGLGSESPVIALGGSRFPFRLGRIVITVYDGESRYLSATPILALFVDEPLGSRPPPVLLGLWRGVLEGRRLVMGPALGDPAGQD